MGDTMDINSNLYNSALTSTSVQKAIKNFFKKNMRVIGSIGQLLFYFQAYTIFSNKHAADVSFIGFCISFFSLTCWLIYGYLIKDKPLILANTVGVLGALLVLAGVLIYG